MITLGVVAASRRCASTFFVKAIGVFVAAGRIKPAIFVLLDLALSCPAGAQIERRDSFIPGGAGRLHVREVSDHGNTTLIIPRWGNSGPGHWWMAGSRKLR
jgi:hypothetical protein